MSELIQHIDTALVGERATCALDNRWDSARNKVIYADEVSAIDNWVDQLLASIRDQAQGYVKDVLRGTALYDHAEHFLAEAFPNGLQALTSLLNVEQVAAVEVLLGERQRSSVIPAATSLAMYGHRNLRQTPESQHLSPIPWWSR